jgi:hypothetical protein
MAGTIMLVSYLPRRIASVYSSIETPLLSSFVSVSGNLDRDIPLGSFVDVDTSAGILDGYRKNRQSFRHRR